MKPRSRWRRPPARSERGATAVEYSLIVALIAAIIAGTVALVGQDTLSNWAISW